MDYGVKISNYQAGSIFEVELGVRQMYDKTDAMLTNSLFLDFLLENGLSIYKNKSTRDVICLNFDYGSRSYEEEIANAQKCERSEDIIKLIENNKDKYRKRTKEQIRIDYYENGVNIRYPIWKDGKIEKYDVIHYNMLYRTPGKAKQGSCMFICDRLYKKARNFLYMGINLPQKNAPIVEIGAYSSLITSTIIGRVQIKPEEILIVEDVDVFCKETVMSIETDENKICHGVIKKDFANKNTLFDGQALIDSSIFPEWGDGYILLRQHFTKCAAFCTHIQKFFKDQFGKEYETKTLTDMFGNKILAKNIKLITTNNAIKWIKFNISFDYWSEWVKKNGCLWGIVKTSHPSKLGTVQRMSYQMVNALTEDIMESVLSESVSHMTNLKTNDAAYLEHLKKNSTFANDYEVLVALYEQNPEFKYSPYFRERKKFVLSTYLKDLKRGRAIQNADNLTIVGSPYAMLLHAIGKDIYEDPTFEVESGAIQCWTARFESEDYLAEFRNPFNGQANMGCLHNKYHVYFDRYFDLGKLVVAVNMIGTNFQSRNNGSDQDSDSIYTTNQPSIVEHAKYCYNYYPTIVNNIPMEKSHYTSSLKDFAIVDNNLAASQLDIGESSNLAQICLTYSYNFDDPKYNEFVCILSVLAQCSIDSAKRKFDVDIGAEIKRIKLEAEVNKVKYPMFWGDIKNGVKQENINKKLRCPMNKIHSLKFSKASNVSCKDYPMNYFFNFSSENKDIKLARKVNEFIERYSIELYKTRNINDFDALDKDQYLLLRDDFENMIENIRAIVPGKKYKFIYSILLQEAFTNTPEFENDDVKIKISKNKSLLLKTLYEVNPEVLLSCFSSKEKNVENVLIYRTYITCVDCGKKVLVSIKDRKTCRCTECKNKYDKKLTRERVKKYRCNASKH